MFFPPVLKLSSVLLKRAGRFLASRFLLQIPLLPWPTNMQPESCQRPMTCPQQTSLIDHNLPFGDSRLGLGILLYTSVQAAIWIQPELAPTAKTMATVPISDSSNSEGGCKEKGNQGQKVLWRSTMMCLSEKFYYCFQSLFTSNIPQDHPSRVED